ncbi:MAG: class IV adenylate cyclase [Nanoarchaeota archaeon]
MLFEVESKIEVDKKDLKEIISRIKKIANFTKKQTKFDQYFSLERAFYPRKAFRIRSEEKDNIVNFKIWVKKFWKGGVVVKEEYEFKIKNKENFLALMKDLGFRKWINKIKISETYQHKKYKKLNIELNEVKNLGYFIEIEYLAKKYEIDKARYLIKKTIKELNINENKINNTGYTKMLWRKKH